jgi:hypothetical protein
MKRLKAIFSAIRTLGRTPTLDIAAAWERVQRDLVPASHNIAGGASSLAERHLIEQAILGVLDEAKAWQKKQGEQVETPAE